MPLYESVFIARQDISSSQAEALADQFVELVTNGGGQVSKKEMWGLKNLAYRIKKNRKGHYALLNIDAPAPVVEELERVMRLNEDVIRYLTIRVAKHEDEPSIMMRSRAGRDDRGGRRGGPRDRGGPSRWGQNGGHGKPAPDGEAKAAADGGGGRGQATPEAGAKQESGA